MKAYAPQICLVLAVLAVSGCSAGSMRGRPISQLSCVDLAREIGKYTQMRDEADADSTIGVVGMILADNREDEIEEGVDSVVGDLTSMSASAELEKLNRAFQQRGCY